MVIETIPQFAWEVEPVRDESGEVVQRNLIIHVIDTITVPPSGPLAPALQAQVETKRIVIPFGRSGAGIAAYDRVGKAMLGEEVPPEIQTAISLPRQVPLGPNGRPR